MTKLVAAAAAIAALTLSLTSPARAADGDSAAPVPGYRTQVLAADAASFGAVFGSMLAEGPDGADTAVSDLLRVTGMGGFLLAAPAIHVSHERYGRAAGSLALRVLLPLAGAAVAAQTATCRPSDFLCGLDEAVVGMMVGAGAASVLDVALLAGGSDEPETGAATSGATAAAAPPPPRPAPGLALSPRLVATPELAFVGVGGRF